MPTARNMDVGDVAPAAYGIVIQGSTRVGEIASDNRASCIMELDFVRRASHDSSLHTCSLCKCIAWPHIRSMMGKTMAERLCMPNCRMFQRLKSGAGSCESKIVLKMVQNVSACMTSMRTGL